MTCRAPAAARAPSHAPLLLLPQKRQAKAVENDNRKSGCSRQIRKGEWVVRFDHFLNGVYVKNGEEFEPVVDENTGERVYVKEPVGAIHTFLIESCLINSAAIMSERADGKFLMAEASRRDMESRNLYRW